MVGDKLGGLSANDPRAAQNGLVGIVANDRLPAHTGATQKSVGSGKAVDAAAAVTLAWL